MTEQTLRSFAMSCECAHHLWPACNGSDAGETTEDDGRDVVITDVCLPAPRCIEESATFHAYEELDSLVTTEHVCLPL